MSAKSLIITIMGLAILGFVLSNQRPLDQIINSLSRLSIHELGILEMNPNYS